MNGEKGLQRENMKYKILKLFIIYAYCGVAAFAAGDAQGAQKKKGLTPAASKGTVTWVQTFGSPALESGYAVSHTADRGSVAVGYSFAANKQEPDLWVIRLNVRGEKIWEKTFPRASHDGSEKYAVCEGVDGSIFVMAPKNIAKGYFYSEVVRVLKLDGRGNVVWEKEFSQGGAVGHAIAATPEGGCLVGGYRSDQSRRIQVGWLIMLDSQGNVVWEKLLESAGAVQKSTAICTTADNHILVAYTALEGGKGLRIAKLDGKGNILWSKTHRSTYGSRNQDIVKSLVLAPEGDIIVAGMTGDLLFNGFVLRLDTFGDRKWDRLVQDSDGGGYAQPSPDGGCLVVFRQYNNSEKRVQILAVKFDASGKVVWSRIIGERGRSYVIFSMDATPDGGFIASGYKSLSVMNSDLLVIKMDGEGRTGKPGLSVDAPGPRHITENTFEPN